MKNKSCIVIVGPTAAGKTSLAIRLAQEFHTEIISADSRQCFRELNIGVAKPDPLQLQQIRHHFINTHSVVEEVNAAIFEEYALKAAAGIFQRSDECILAGGTGLYVKAFCEGMDEILPVAPEIRIKVRYDYEQNGLKWLQDQVAQNDPDYFKQGEILNPQRLMRSLEVMLSTGKSIISFRNTVKKTREFKIFKFGLELPREELYRNIDQRVDDMTRQGLVEEVRKLLPFRHFNALHTVGYSELFEYLDKKILLDDAIRQIKKNTRYYAKRQMTWFKKDESITWIAPNDLDSLKAYCGL